MGELATFRANYAAFVAQYRGQPVTDATLSARDAVTQKAVNDLRLSMSADGWQIFNTFIQGQKARMRRIPMPDMSHIQ